MAGTIAGVIDLVRKLEQNLAKVVVGKADTIRLTLIPLLCRGHLLIEDVPGVGKTTLARALACSIEGDFRRVQFTPDLLPLDLTGSSIFNQKNHEFEFKPGPVFTNILLADELNRATPRTQSALLECMEENQVTVDGETRLLPPVFLVVATLNPVEQTGTFELPETQLDRFMIRARMGYPTEAEEVQIFDRQARVHPLASLGPVLSVDDVERLRDAVPDVHVDDSVKAYATQLVRATREHEAVHLGASPRGTLSLIRASQALALITEAGFVSPDHVKALAPAVLEHRIILRPQAALRGVTGAHVVAEVLKRVEVPIGTRGRP